MSIVGLIEEGGIERIIAEGRYVLMKDRPLADTAFVVDEKYQGTGIGTFILNMLITFAREQGIKGFTADVLADNKGMLKVYEKSGYPIQAVVEYGVYHLTLPFSERSETQPDLSAK
jgi:RimJ/RimL family protein N-acetyltransferase